MKMIQALKEEMKISPKQVEEKTNKKWKKIKKSHNESQEKKTMKQLKETAQDLKTEIETIKKP